jgi:hypothetical protein
MDKTVLDRAAAQLSEDWVLYPFTGSNCKKTVSNQSVQAGRNAAKPNILSTCSPNLPAISLFPDPHSEFNHPTRVQR